MPHTLCLLPRWSDNAMQSTIQSSADKLDERIAEIDDRRTGLGNNVLPFSRVRVHDLEAAKLVEEDGDGAEVGVFA